MSIEHQKGNKITTFLDFIIDLKPNNKQKYVLQVKRKTRLPEIVDYVKDAVIYMNGCLTFIHH